MASLSCGVLWRITDKASISGGAFYNHNWIIGVVVVLTAQVGLLLSVSAAVAAPRGSKWRAALPGFAASVVAISFWAFSG
jgi:hypothetical protein